jgi:predicted ArsR family transcriptional regulator
MKENIGAEGAKKIIQMAGIKKGKQIIEELASKYNLTGWTPQIFKAKYVEGYLTQIGVQPEVLRVSSDRVVFREHSCQFLEVATRYPELICDVLDAAVHQGIGGALGNVKIVRTRCMGHGDDYCEYSVLWKKA